MTVPQEVRLARHAVDLDDDGHLPAANVPIDDVGGFYTGTDVEAALQEIAGGVTGGAFLTKIEGGQDTIKPHGLMGSTETLDPTDGNIHTGTLNADCTIGLAAPSGSGAAEIEFEVLASGTHTWSFPDVTVWLTSGGAAPSPPASGLSSIIIFRSLDGGATWYGIPVGAGGVDLSAIDFLVGTASGLLAGEIVVGTTPGGELGGTWASPTVDTTHAGSTHAATQAAAEAAAAAALAAHIASSGSSDGAHAHVAEETHLSNGSTVTWTLDQAYQPGSVIAWNITTLARLTVTEVLPDQATVSAAGTTGDKIVFDYAATLV